MYMGVPGQPVSKSSLSSKAAGLTFLGGLGARWSTSLHAARAVCVAASAEAASAVTAADAAIADAASLGPVATPPTVLPAEPMTVKPESQVGHIVDTIPESVCEKQSCTVALGEGTDT
jgi:hypothetical protein